jgi:hypothetical protein
MAATTFSINNVTAGTLTYQGQAIAGGASYTPATYLQSLFASDAGVLADVLAGNLSITVGANTQSYQTGVTILNAVASSVFTGINSLGQYQAIVVGTTAVEAKGAGARLQNRQILVITPTNGIIYWGTSAGVTTATGSPIFKNQQLSLSFADSVPVYLIGTANTDVRIFEGT